MTIRKQIILALGICLSLTACGASGTTYPDYMSASTADTEEDASAEQENEGEESGNEEAEGEETDAETVIILNDESDVSYKLQRVGTREAGVRTDTVYLMEIDDPTLLVNSISATADGEAVESKLSMIPIHPNMNTEALIGNYDAASYDNAMLYTIVACADDSAEDVVLTADVLNKNNGLQYELSLQCNTEDIQSIVSNEICISSGVFYLDDIPVYIDASQRTVSVYTDESSSSERLVWPLTMTVLSQDADVDTVKNTVLKSISPAAWENAAGQYVPIENIGIEGVYKYSALSDTQENVSSRTFTVMYGYTAVNHEQAELLKQYLQEAGDTVAPKIETTNTKVIIGEINNSL